EAAAAEREELEGRLLARHGAVLGVDRAPDREVDLPALLAQAELEDARLLVHLDELADLGHGDVRHVARERAGDRDDDGARAVVVVVAPAAQALLLEELERSDADL